MSKASKYAVGLDDPGFIPDLGSSLDLEMSTIPMNPTRRGSSSGPPPHELDDNVRSTFEKGLELRPELQITALMADVSISTQKYREKARRLLQAQLSEQDVDLSRNWAVRRTRPPGHAPGHARASARAVAGQAPRL